MNVPKRTDRGEHFSLGCAETWDALARGGLRLADFAAEVPTWGNSRVRRILYGDTEPRAKEIEALSGFGVPRDAWTKPPPKAWRFPHDPKRSRKTGST
jgi:hypothetical protein